MSPVEVRIHGVGDHKPLSALGRVTLSPVQFSGIDSYVMPATPPHDLELVNWSRTSRGIAGFVWYLATPFTLMNVVGYMKPAANEGRRRHGVVTHLASLLVTAVLTAWLITITETVLEYCRGRLRRRVRALCRRLGMERDTGGGPRAAESLPPPCRDPSA